MESFSTYFDSDFKTWKTNPLVFHLFHIELPFPTYCDIKRHPWEKGVNPSTFMTVFCRIRPVKTF